LEHRVFVCSHVFIQSRPILLVAKMDGDLCFLCGQNHLDSADDYEAVGLNHILGRDPSIGHLLDKLEENHEAERESVGATWRFSPSLPD
jgi:hypothetical protein